MAPIRPAIPTMTLSKTAEMKKQIDMLHIAAIRNMM